MIRPTAVIERGGLRFGLIGLIVGNGFFKPNISVMVGNLYEPGDPKRDSGFNIFYMGINIGALLATVVVAPIGETYGFMWGFGLAGVGMLVGVAIFLLGQDKLEGAEVVIASRDEARIQRADGELEAKTGRAPLAVAALRALKVDPSRW